MQSNRRKRVLGVDPGTQKTGYAVVSDEPRPSSLEHGVIAFPRNLPLEKRLHRLHAAITEIIAKHRPDAVAVESPFVGKSAHSAIAIGQAQGIVMVCAEASGIPILKYQPARIKHALTNNGRASKKDMIHMASVTLELEQPPQEDAADALAVALCHIGAEQERRINQQTEDRQSWKPRPAGAPPQACRTAGAGASSRKKDPETQPGIQQDKGSRR